MTQEQIVARVLELVKANRPFMLGTVDEQNSPQMRWMGVVILDDAQPKICYMSSHSDARKMKQIAQNPKAQLVFSSEDTMCVATINGTAQVDSSLDIKQKMWDQTPILSNYFKGPDDPNFGLIKFTATRIEIFDMRTAEEMGVVEF